jgi:hypothetical protein
MITCVASGDLVQTQNPGRFALRPCSLHLTLGSIQLAHHTLSPSFQQLATSLTTCTPFGARIHFPNLRFCAFEPRKTECRSPGRIRTRAWYLRCRTQGEGREAWLCRHPSLQGERDLRTR